MNNILWASTNNSSKNNTSEREFIIIFIFIIISMISIERNIYRQTYRDRPTTADNDAILKDIWNVLRLGREIFMFVYDLRSL